MLENELLAARLDVHPEVADLMERAAIWIIAAKSSLVLEKPRELTSEAAELTKLLTEVGNNRAEAARRLGISRRAFYKRLHKHDLVSF